MNLGDDADTRGPTGDLSLTPKGCRPDSDHSITGYPDYETRYTIIRRSAIGRWRRAGETAFLHRTSTLLLDLRSSLAEQSADLRLYILDLMHGRWGCLVHGWQLLLNSPDRPRIDDTACSSIVEEDQLLHERTDRHRQHDSAVLWRVGMLFRNGLTRSGSFCDQAVTGQLQKHLWQIAKEDLHYQLVVLATNRQRPDPVTPRLNLGRFECRKTEQP